MEDALLPAVLPVTARRVWVTTASREGTFRAAGAVLDPVDPDVEIGALTAISNRAGLVLVPMGQDPAVRDRRSRWTRAVRRIDGHVRLRLAVARSRRALARVGYPSTDAVLWDRGHALAVEGVTDDQFRRVRGPNRLPQRALVSGRRVGAEQTILSHVLEEASRATGSDLRVERILPKSGMLIVLTTTHVLRVAVGAARDRIAAQHEQLQALLADHLPSSGVADLLPDPLTLEVAGLAAWSMEPRLEGERPSAPLSTALRRQVMDFLVGLHSAGHSPGAVVRKLHDDAAFVAQGRGCAGEHMLSPLVDGIVRRVQDLPTGYGHGDFFDGNLLVSDDRLTGVIDWDTGTAGQLPLIDLIHLRLSAERAPGSTQWGPGIVQRLLPWAANGGDSSADEYCRRLGIEPDPSTLTALVAAYWLQRLAYQLRTYEDRLHRPLWLQRNIDDVLPHLRSALL